MDTTFDYMSKDELKTFLSHIKISYKVSSDKIKRYEQELQNVKETEDKILYSLNHNKESCDEMESVIYELESRIRNF